MYIANERYLLLCAFEVAHRQLSPGFELHGRWRRRLPKVRHRRKSPTLSHAKPRSTRLFINAAKYVPTPTRRLRRARVKFVAIGRKNKRRVSTRLPLKKNNAHGTIKNEEFRILKGGGLDLGC